MDLLQQILVAIGVGFVGAGQARHRRAELGGRSLEQLILPLHLAGGR